MTRSRELVHAAHVGGFHVFGGSEKAPSVLLNPTYGTVTLGQPLEAASLLNRLQTISPVPLLNTADFEAGVGFRIAGATAFPRAMAFGAAGDERLAYEAGRVDGGRGPRPRHPRQLRSRRRRQQQPAQSGDQHALVRRGSGARRPPRVRVRARAPGGWRDRHAQALSRPRRYRRRLAPRPADHQAPARAARSARAGALPRGRSPPAPRA